MTLRPDTKDWTWVLDRPCPECGFDPAVIAPGEVGAQIRATTPAFEAALAMPGATQRAVADRWSALEYACHVRDVHRIFADRVDLMLTTDDPQFENWDQDATAVADAYHVQDPRAVAAALAEAAEAVAGLYDQVEPDQWPRTGRRSNGSEFTVATIALYHLHDVVHHVADLAHASAGGGG